MSDNNDCASSIYVCAMRIARLDDDGSILIGTENMLITDALAKLTWDPDIEAGTEHTQKNGCGDIKASLKKRDQVKRLNLTLDILSPDPDLQEILVGGTVLADGDGYAYPDLGAISDDRVSIECWSRAVIDGDFATTNPYIWWAFPETQWQYGARNLEEDYMGLPFSGTATENPNWFNGPGNDWPEASTQVVQHLRTDDIPDTACGYQTTIAS